MRKFNAVGAFLSIGAALALVLTGCAASPKGPVDWNQSCRDIAQLATEEAYYHCVGSNDKNVNILNFTLGSTEYWIEYDATVQFGVDIANMTVDAPNESGNVVVHLPQAQVLGSPVIDSSSLKSYQQLSLVPLNGDDKAQALQAAVVQAQGKAEQDDTTKAAARERAKSLVEGYIKGVGEALGKTYTVTFVDA